MMKNPNRNDEAFETMPDTIFCTSSVFDSDEVMLVTSLLKSNALRKAVGSPILSRKDSYEVMTFSNFSGMLFRRLLISLTKSDASLSTTVIKK